MNKTQREMKVITLANHKGHRQSSEPIKTRSKYMQPERSAGKRIWFWFYFSVVETAARAFQTINGRYMIFKPISKGSNSNELLSKLK